MLRLRGLLIAAVLLVALAGVVFWSKKAKQVEEKETVSATAAPKILDIPYDKIAKLEFRRRGSEPVVAEHKGKKWALIASKFPTDSGELNILVAGLAPLNADRLVTDKTSDLGQYGLATPSFELDVTETGGAVHRLLFGDEVPTGSGFYAKLAGSPKVFTVATDTKNNLDKTANDLRDRRLIAFDSGKLTRIDLLVKGQTIEFGKNNQNDWQILKPRPLRADGGLVEDLIRKLQEAKMEFPASPEDAKKAAAAFAAGTPVAIASVTDAVGTHQLQVRKDKAGDYYAEGSAQEGIYKIASDVGAALDKNLDDFRNKKIFDFAWMDPNGIDIRDGTNSVSYRRSGDKWTSGGKTMDTVTIETLIDKLRGLTATQFVEKPFSSPSIDLTVTSLDGKRVEKVSLAQAGNIWLARRENEPTIYQLDANVVAELQKAIASVKEAPKAAKK
jgi:hypothetical protein